MSHGISLRLAAGLLVLALGLLAAACETSPTPTPTPTATPTPTPTPLAPFAISEGATYANIFGQLPAREQECIRQGLGEPALGQFLGRDFEGETLPEENEVLAQCLSQESASRLFIGAIGGEVGGLSDATITCMRNTLADVDLPALFAAEDEEEEEGFALFLGALLCLNDEEAARASGLFGDEEGLSVADIRCVAERVDLGLLVQFFEEFFEAAGEGEIPIQELLEAFQEVLDAFQACGVELEELLGPGEAAPDGLGELDLTLEQRACIGDSLEPGVLHELRTGARLPTPEELQALQACGVELEELGGPGEAEPPSLSELEITSEQRTCIVANLDPGVMFELLFEGRLPTPEEFQVLISCGLDVSAIISGGS